MNELREECGVAAIYHLPGPGVSPLCPVQGPEEVSRLMPRMLLDIQNRGQLAAGMTTYNPDRNQLIDTHKEVGSVSEVFRIGHQGKHLNLMREYAGRAAIGHVRYATCGRDDRSYAQPFERHHIKKHKWFSFGFNGQLANYGELRNELLGDNNNYLSRETDTEIIMHQLCTALSSDRHPSLLEVCGRLARKFDGAYSLVFLDALGNMMVVRDPLGIKPLSYAIEGPLFAAASETVALMNLGFAQDNIQSLPPGHAAIVSNGQFRVESFAPSPHRAHCFFEWVYFSNVASTLDGRSVYLARKALGEELARLETVSIDEDTIVVPVPDTSKAAADAMAYALKIPSVEGLIRNRYSGRTFIDGGSAREGKAQTKYTPLRDLLEGKRVLLVEDSIVRGTTLKMLLARLRRVGHPREIHVRVACPPIISPCFYGIDMSTFSELLAPHYLQGGPMTPQIEAKMAAELEADSLRYLPVEAVARAIGFDASDLCQACITGDYPTPCGRKLADIALENDRNRIAGRTYEAVGGGS
ncbi:MAG: amidophosphoribosyltransferase [Pirellulales bacterium]|nr:amidophosphoribosyltransferase [Pirellulales bacterium]